MVGFVGASPSDDRGEWPAVRSAPAIAASAPTIRQSIFVDHPSDGGELVTTRDIVIRGRIAPEVKSVRIILESRNGKPVAAQSIEPRDAVRGGLLPFEGRFRLAVARPFGRIVALVIAVDAAGVPIDAIRRRFDLGDILEEPHAAGF